MFYVSDENKQVVLAPKQIRCRTEPNGFSIINFGDQMGTGLWYFFTRKLEGVLSHTLF